MKKICFITTSRADYGLIKSVISAAGKQFDTQIIVTGSHVSTKHGMTVNEIRKDGLRISAQIKMHLDSDKPKDIVKSVGLELGGLAKAFHKLKPDYIFVTGDRYEMLAAAYAALIFRIPIIHLYGGDVTEGALDDSCRHAISKLSGLHFTSTESSRGRLIQMGEQTNTVFNVGSPSLDKIKTLKFLTKPQLEEALKIKLSNRILLVTFHPETLTKTSVKRQVTELSATLSSLDNSHTIIITMPNADPDGLAIRNEWKKLAKSGKNIHVFESLGYQKYFSLMKISDMVIGNSSSGLYEAPSFKIPTINIGTRQKGRERAASVIDVMCKSDKIVAAMNAAKRLDCSTTKNPYGNGDSAKKIVALMSKHCSAELIFKKFRDV